MELRKLVWKTNKSNAQQLQRIWTIGIMKKWFCIWDNLLRLFAIEWIASFRKQVSQIFTLQQQYDLIIKDCSVEELDSLLKELDMTSNEIRFMFDPTDKRRDKLEELFAEIFDNFRNKQTEDFAKKQYQIIKITDSIISKQRKKIIELDNSEPII